MSYFYKDKLKEEDDGKEPRIKETNYSLEDSVPRFQSPEFSKYNSSPLLDTPKTPRKSSYYGGPPAEKVAIISEIERDEEVFFFLNQVTRLTVEITPNERKPNWSVWDITSTVRNQQGSLRIAKTTRDFFEWDILQYCLVLRFPSFIAAPLIACYDVPASKRDQDTELVSMFLRSILQNSQVATSTIFVSFIGLQLRDCERWDAMKPVWYVRRNQISTKEMTFHQDCYLRAETYCRPDHASIRENEILLTSDNSFVNSAMTTREHILRLMFSAIKVEEIVLKQRSAILSLVDAMKGTGEIVPWATNNPHTRTTGWTDQLRMKVAIQQCRNMLFLDTRISDIKDTNTIPTTEIRCAVYELLQELQTSLHNCIKHTEALVASSRESTGNTLAKMIMHRSDPKDS